MSSKRTREEEEEEECQESEMKKVQHKEFLYYPFESFTVECLSLQRILEQDKRIKELEAENSQLKKFNYQLQEGELSLCSP